MAPPRRATGAIPNYYAPTTVLKRKAIENDGSEKENSPATTEIAEPPQKKSKPSATTTTKKPKTAAKVAKPKAPAPKKLLNDTVKAIAKEVKKMDKAVKKMDRNDKYGLNIENYVDISTSHLSVVHKLAQCDVVLAWNLVLHLGDVAATDLDRHFRLCGYGDHESGFAELDQVLLDLVERRTLPEARIEILPDVPHRWTRADADVGDFKTGRPNKQQYNQMCNDRIEWEEERREAKMERRAGCQDWVAVALADLKAEKEYLDAYGVEGFFVKSIAKLEILDEARQTSNGGTS